MSIFEGDGGIPAPQLDISKTSAVVCTCGNHTFTHGVFLREISALISPTGKAGVIPVPTFTCNACGKVPDVVLPPFIVKEAKEASSKATNIPSYSQNTPKVTPSTPTITKGGLTLLKD